jgi:hypothetical protein
MKRKVDMPGMIMAFVLISIAALAAWGWVWNIVKIVDHEGGVGMMIVRVAGIFLPPLGSVVGYF